MFGDLEESGRSEFTEIFASALFAIRKGGRDIMAFTLKAACQSIVL
jgi:hypothetical protein